MPLLRIRCHDVNPFSSSLALHLCLAAGEEELVKHPMPHLMDARHTSGNYRDGDMTGCTTQGENAVVFCRKNVTGEVGSSKHLRSNLMDIRYTSEW